jgi:hypothetical protein
MEPDNNSPGQNGPTGGNTPPPPIEDQPQVVYMTRPIEPRRQTISEDVKKRHEESRRTYPFLNISEGEYVIFAIKRHPIGLVYVWGSVGFVILAAFALIMVLAAGGNAVSSMSGVTLSPTILLIPAVLISLLATIFGFILPMRVLYSISRRGCLTGVSKRLVWRISKTPVIARTVYYRMFSITDNCGCRLKVMKRRIGLTMPAIRYGKLQFSIMPSKTSRISGPLSR